MRLVWCVYNLTFHHIGVSCHAIAVLFRVGLQWLSFLLLVDYLTVSPAQPIKIRIQPFFWHMSTSHVSRWVNDAMTWLRIVDIDF